MTFKEWSEKNLGVDEDGSVFFWREKLDGRVRSAVSLTEFEECWYAAQNAYSDDLITDAMNALIEDK